MESVRIQGAFQHNLKNVSLDIPKRKLVVITGVSGSGKSTLAFDVLYREGRRRYERAVGSQSVDEEEGFESIAGLTPTVAVEQRIIRQTNPRSLVGTRSGILSLMQIVFSLVGQYPCLCGGVTDSRRVCQECGRKVESLPTSYFNFNSPLGMCLKCFGTGRISTATPESVMTNPRFQGPLFRASPAKLRDGLNRLAKAYHFGPNVSYKDMPDKAQHAYMYGDLTVGYEGLIPFLQRIGAGDTRFESTVCPSCNGARLGEEARDITIGGLNISQLAHTTLQELSLFWQEESGHLTQADPNIGLVLKKIQSKIKNLRDVGLSHLSLYRPTPTLSGGELQRLFLASYLDSDLESLIYVFDEPTVGLHEREKSLLLERLRDLLELGNSVIVVEHDLGVIRSADWIIEIGPGAGDEGGRIVYEGEMQGYLTNQISKIAPYVRGYPKPNHQSSFRQPRIFEMTDSTLKLTVYNANAHNLKNISVSIPLGVMVGVSGVSGSGKSSLVSSTLVPLIAKSLKAEIDDEQDDEDKSMNEPICATLVGAEQLSGVAVVTQAPIGRSKTSTPASYIGIWDRVRTLFANQACARNLVFTPGDFSFNSTGACPECQGEGVIRKETRNMVFTWPCHVCKGARFRPEVLEIRIDGKSIAEVLDMSVAEATQFFKNEPAICDPLQILKDVGMGYLRLGQPATTISGGEAQRIKLAKALGRTRGGNTLYILDEPTCGLSAADTTCLMDLLMGLVDQGNSVLIIEHDLSVLEECDWLIEMGPGGGNEGGEVIAWGSPEQLTKMPTSIIAKYWREGVQGK